MECYRKGGCGPYEMYSCYECPARHPEYADKYNREEDKMTTQEKIANAEAKIAKWQEKLNALKQQEQEKPLTGWGSFKERTGDSFYYYISDDGPCEDFETVQSFDIGFCRDRGDMVDEHRKQTLNAFSTREKAKEIANTQLAYRIAKKFADTWEGERDGRSWGILYNKRTEKINHYASNELVSMLDVFPSQMCVEAFIDQHGKEYAQLIGWELEEKDNE